MKLKYYMRGLGIGILITTIVLSIAGKKEKLSDEEVIARAKELGMAMKEDTNSSLEDILEKSLDKADQADDETDTAIDVGNTGDDIGNAGDDAESSDGTDTAIDVGNTGDDAGNAGDDTESSDGTDTAIDTGNTGDDTGNAGDDTVPSDETDTAIDVGNTGDDAESSDDTDNITFTISRGMSSGQVAKLIMDKGIITDAIDFDNYIKQKGKASVIRIGTYTLEKGSSYQEILDAITG